MRGGGRRRRRNLDTLQGARREQSRPAHERPLLDARDDPRVRRRPPRRAVRGHRDETARRHAEHFLALVERVEPELEGEHQTDGLDTPRAGAPEPARSAPRGVDSVRPPDLGVRLAGALRPFWSKRGHLTEGRTWLAAALDADESRSPARDEGAVRSRSARHPSGGLAGGDPAVQGSATSSALELGDERSRRSRSSRSAEPHSATGDEQEAARSSSRRPNARRGTATARSHAMARLNLGYLGAAGGDHPRAEAALQPPAPVRGASRRLRRRPLARGARFGRDPEGRTATRSRLLQASLELERVAQDAENVAWPLQLLGIAEAETAPEHAATLLGAAEALRQSLDSRCKVSNWPCTSRRWRGSRPCSTPRRFARPGRPDAPFRRRAIQTRSQAIPPLYRALNRPSELSTQRRSDESDSSRSSLAVASLAAVLASTATSASSNWTITPVATGSTARAG